MATFTPLAGAACPWQVVAVVRCVIPLLVVIAWARWDRVPLVYWGPPVLWLRSLAGSGSLIGTFYALHHMPLTDIYTIVNIFPIWVALLTWFTTGRIPALSVWISIFCSILGVAILQGAHLRAGNYTALVVVAVSLFTALAMMGLNRLQEIDPRAIVAHFSATALVFSVLCLFIFPLKTPEAPFDVGHLFELLAVGASATFGQFFLTKAFTTGDPAKVSVASLSQFVFILILDVLVLGHPLDWSKLWGVPLILGPTAWLMMQRARVREPQIALPGRALCILRNLVRVKMGTMLSLTLPARQNRRRNIQKDSVNVQSR
jgi:drug/metabolite transporter (DMT)-like permease